MCNHSEASHTDTSAQQPASGCPVPGNIPGEAGRGSEQPDRAVGVPVHCRGFGPDDL